MAKSQRTQVKLKTLHPVFDELFYLWVVVHNLPLSIYMCICTCIWFVWFLYLPVMLVLNSTDTGLLVWPSLWWTMIGFPPTTLPVKLWLLSVTSAGQGDRTLQLLARVSSRSFCTCLAVNQVVHIAPGCIKSVLFFFRTNIILAFWQTRRCRSGFPITSPIHHQSTFNLEIFVSGVGTTLICSLSPAEKPIMRMLDARTGDREAQEFVRRLKEIEKSMEEE